MQYGCNSLRPKLVVAKNLCIMTYMHYDDMHYEKVDCIHIFPLISWCTLTQQVWCKRAGKVARTRHAVTIERRFRRSGVSASWPLTTSSTRRFLAAAHDSAQSPRQRSPMHSCRTRASPRYKTNRVSSRWESQANACVLRRAGARDVSTFAEGDCSHEERSHHR
jgi:hypothetical protein